MLGKTHFITGVALGSFAISHNVLEPTLVNWAVIVIGSLIPDIDKCGSIASDKIIIPFYLLFKHRGFTHSIVGGACLMMIVQLFLKNSEIAFLIGFSAHIVPDWLTSHGIKIFWPFSDMKKAPLTFPTGSTFEYVFSFAMSIFTLINISKMVSI
ncbi:MAG: metal-dependent hydrolase [Clostridia bacterium]|nr:metal-dependent hydrolase [Clostridia bacterium]